MSSNGLDPRKRIAHAAVHAALAGGFFFVFQRYAMQAGLETSLVWALALAAGAAALSWRQTRS